MFFSVENLGQFSPTSVTGLPYVPPTSYSGSSSTPLPMTCPPGSVWRPVPTAPTYSAQYTIQLQQPHSSGIHVGEPCPPEEGSVYRTQWGSIFRGAGGRSYVLINGTWMTCPTWPSLPDLHGSLANAIVNFRHYWDAANHVSQYLRTLNVPNIINTFVGVCPGSENSPYALKRHLSGELAAKFGLAGSYPPFANWIWWQVSPEGGSAMEQAWLNYTYNPSNPPVRPDPAEVEKAASKLSTIVKAWDSVPWPHEFMKSFITNPKVDVPPFYQNYRLNDPGIVGTDYLPRPEEAIAGDIARYIAANEDLFNKNFEVEVETWIKRQEERIKRQQENLEQLNKFIMIFGFALDLFTAGMGSLVLSAISAPVTIKMTKDMTKAQVDSVKKFQEILGITQAGIEKFRLWILANIDKKVEVPQSPSGPMKQYSVFIENKFWHSFDTETEAIKVVYNQTSVGNRIIVKNEASGEVVGMYLREANGLRKIPASMAGKVQAMPEQSAAKVAGGNGFPVWILAIPLALKFV